MGPFMDKESIDLQVEIILLESEGLERCGMGIIFLEEVKSYLKS